MQAANFLVSFLKTGHCREGTVAGLSRPILAGSWCWLSTWLYSHSGGIQVPGKAEVAQEDLGVILTILRETGSNLRL